MPKVVWLVAGATAAAAVALVLVVVKKRKEIVEKFDELATTAFTDD